MSARRLRVRRGLWLPAAVILVLVSLSLLPDSQQRGITSLAAVPRAVLTTLMSPITHASHASLSSAGNATTPQPRLGDPRQLADDYLALLTLTRQLEHELLSARVKIAQLSQIRSELHLDQVHLLPVSVTAVDPRPPLRTMTINRGRDAGLVEGLVVAQGFHLLGRVVTVEPRSSVVQLITSRNAAPFVRIVPPRPGMAPREAASELHVAPDGSHFIAKTGADSQIAIDDLAHLFDEGWPREASGLVVGQVSHVEPWPDDPLLYRRVVLQPVAQVAQTRQVVVLVPHHVNR